ncbi:FG-GAP repeat protein [bacterium]|nr:FG-GAP repeat protein [bacterium]
MIIMNRGKRLQLWNLLFYCLFIGRAFSGISLVQHFSEENNKGDTRFGFSVSGAGDVNNDGYDDVIVGAYAYDAFTGRSYIFFGGSPMDNIADVIVTGEGTNDRFGYSVSGAGDVNNDGYDDVIVGAYEYTSNTGRAYLYLGGSAMDNTADVIMTGETTNVLFGFSVSGSGDVNNDGYDDVVVGAYFNNDCGRVYVYYGGSTMDNTADVTMDGTAYNDTFGYSVSSAGDVNNDGYSDVLVGSQGYNSQNGRAYIYFGGASMDNTADVIMEGEGTDTRFGRSVSGAGDVNNDNYDDVIIGAERYNTNVGRAYIFLGGTAMDNTADVVMTGEGASDLFGNSVSDAGDVNNDGYDDVIVGAHYYEYQAGRAYIFFGGSTMNAIADVYITGAGTNHFLGCSVSGAGDVNNDNYDDVIVGETDWLNGGIKIASTNIYFGGSSMNNTADVTMVGEGTHNYFGYSVSVAGDVNNDNYDDVIVGAYQYDLFTGRAYIYYGAPDMDDLPDVTLTGEGPDDYFGYSVSNAGDVNNDGYDDVIVGANYYASETGRAYIFFGGASMNSTADVILTGESVDNYFGCSVSDAGDVNNDNYDDVIVGAFEYLPTKYGRAYVYYGGPSMDNSADVIMQGEMSSSRLGCSVSGAGDVNSDNYDDVIVGAYTYSSETGRAYIYFGGSAMDNTPDVTLTGESTTNQFGYSVSHAGDVNGDNYSDVIVGAVRYSSYTGRSYIYFGGSSMDNTADVIMTGETAGDYFGCSVSGAGDINNDSYDDVIAGAYKYSTSTGRAYIYLGGSVMDNTADFTLTGTAANQCLGISISNAGDVDNDGMGEIIVGAYKDGYLTNGTAYLFTVEPACISIKVFIEGAYAGGSVLNTTLLDEGHLPTTSPYGDGRSVSAVPAGITDWIFVELRSAEEGPAIASKSFFLRNDGMIVDLDGTTTELPFETVDAGLYHIVVRHRNHLAIISENPENIGQ